MTGDVGPIHPAHLPALQTAFSQEAHQFGREYDVEIGGQHELASRAANAHVLGDHLVQRYRSRIRQAIVNFAWHLDKANLARAHVERPPQIVHQPGAVRRRVPLHYDDLG
jgi:hypothetical protein